MTFKARLVAVGLAIALPLLADAQQPLLISGTVFEDHAALAVRSGLSPAGLVELRLYADDGDSQPGNNDRLVATTTTNAVGAWVIKVERPGNYWIAVNSKSFTHGWPEQTFGPAGSLCARPDGSTVRLGIEGSCFSGRRFDASDDAATLDCSEHVAFIELRENRTGVDFAFSYDAVTNTQDGENVQGSLRRFLLNAAAEPGPNRMRFVPIEPAREQRESNFGLPPRWWRVDVKAPLPVISDLGTVVDGTAYSYVSAASVVNVLPGRYQEAATLRPSEPLSKIEKPELEIVTASPEGLICEAQCAIRSISIHGSPVSVVLRDESRLEQVMIGSSPDGVPATRGNVGIQIERGTAIARQMLVTTQTSAGVVVGPNGKLDAERAEIHGCGQPQSGAAVLILSSGSAIRSSNISANPGAAIVLGALDGSSPATQVAIDGSTISGNLAGVVLAPGARRNAITRNDMIWNRFGGITIAPFGEGQAPRENRISRNHFDENGYRPIVLDLRAENANVLARGAERCERQPELPNGGMAAPKITSVRLIEEQEDPTKAQVVVRGTACPSDTVELYQSFITSAIREAQPEVTRVRADEDERETLTNDERAKALPSIGEFNFLGTATADEQGRFEAIFPLAVVITDTTRDPDTDADVDIWGVEVLASGKVTDRAFSGIAIDALGNTSEMGVRRQID